MNTVIIEPKLAQITIKGLDSDTTLYAVREVEFRVTRELSIYMSVEYGDNNHKSVRVDSIRTTASGADVRVVDNIIRTGEYTSIIVGDGLDIAYYNGVLLLGNRRDNKLCDYIECHSLEVLEW